MNEISTDEHKIHDLLDRYVQTVYPSKEEAVKRFHSGSRLRFYLGIDPTGAHIHLGHATNLLWLKRLIAMGHEAVILIGDFTARIGDPTDKAATRKALTQDEVSENMTNYLDQVQKVLPAGSFTVEYNSSWLASLNFEDLIKLASHVTVQQMIQRDMFRERLKQEKPIFVHEFFYPLMQGYDSVALRTDGEVGGNDQTFNMLMGRDLERDLIGKDKLVITTRLLLAPGTGEKIMNKSEGTVIALDDSPQEMRRKILAVNDAMIATMFELCTEVPREWISQRQEALSAGENPRKFKEELAAELVRIYHGTEAVSGTSEPEQIENKGTVLTTAYAVGVVPSLGELKKLIKEGGVQLNGEQIERWDLETKKGDEIRLGKGRFYKVI